MMIAVVGIMITTDDSNSSAQSRALSNATAYAIANSSAYPAPSSISTITDMLVVIIRA